MYQTLANSLKYTVHGCKVHGGGEGGREGHVSRSLILNALRAQCLVIDDVIFISWLIDLVYSTENWLTPTERDQILNKPKQGTMAGKRIGRKEQTGIFLGRTEAKNTSLWIHTASLPKRFQRASFGCCFCVIPLRLLISCGTTEGVVRMQSGESTRRQGNKGGWLWGVTLVGGATAPVEAGNAVLP